jgi:hypothetical protein
MRRTPSEMSTLEIVGGTSISIVFHANLQVLNSVQFFPPPKRSRNYSVCRALPKISIFVNDMMHESCMNHDVLLGAPFFHVWVVYDCFSVTRRQEI